MTKNPCPEVGNQFACTDRTQCFEPCGDLGHSAEHAVVHQASAELLALTQAHAAGGRHAGSPRCGRCAEQNAPQ